MGELHFQGLPTDVHHCTSHRDGDWIIWRCPHCEGFERKFNFVTEEMWVRRGNSRARHTGSIVNDQNMTALRNGLSPN